MLPYSAAYNRDAAHEAMERVARALHVADAPNGLYDLLQKVGTQKSLRDFGLDESDLDRASDQAVSNPYFNPRPVTRDGVRGMLQQAYEGNRP